MKINGLDSKECNPADNFHFITYQTEIPLAHNQKVHIYGLYSIIYTVYIYSIMYLSVFMYRKNEILNNVGLFLVEDMQTPFP